MRARGASCKEYRRGVKNKSGQPNIYTRLLIPHDDGSFASATNGLETKVLCQSTTTGVWVSLFILKQMGKNNPACDYYFPNAYSYVN